MADSAPEVTTKLLQALEDARQEVVRKHGGYGKYDVSILGGIVLMRRNLTEAAAQLHIKEREKGLESLLLVAGEVINILAFYGEYRDNGEADDGEVFSVPR